MRFQLKISLFSTDFNQTKQRQVFLNLLPMKEQKTLKLV